MDRIARHLAERDLMPWEGSVIEEGELYLVGGVVRDILLGREGEMVDNDYIVTGVEFERLMEVLEKHGKTDLVGRSFGVIKFRPAGGVEVDISLPRRERSTGPGHRDFNVQSDPSISVEEDLVRRDFTINSMAVDLGSGRLVDPLGGRKDLEDSILRVNTADSFIEDPLRIMRGVQFMARFALEVEEETGDSMKRHARLLDTVSPERTRMEFDKLLLLSERPSRGLVLMHETGVMARLVPELEDTWGVEQNEFHEDDVFHHSIKSCDMAQPKLHLRLAALFHDLGKVTTKKHIGDRIVFYRHEEESAALTASIMKRLVYSREMTGRVVHLVKNHMFFITEEWSDSAVRRFIAKVGSENIDDLMELRLADGGSRGETGRATAEEVRYARERIEKILESDSALCRKDLAVGGHDIMEETGIGEGAGLGWIIDSLLEAVIEDPAMNRREELLRMAGELADEAKKRGRLP